MSNSGDNLRATYAWSSPDTPTSTPSLVLTYVSGGHATPGVSWTLGLGAATASTSSGTITFNPASAANFLCTSVCVRTVTPPGGYGSALPEGTYSAVMTFSRPPTGSTSTSNASTVTWDSMTLPPTMTAPTSSSVGGATGLVVTYDLNEAAKAGSVSLAFAGTGLCAGSAVTLTMADAQVVSTTINPESPAGSASVQAVAGSFVAGCTYNITLSYQDAQNHAAASVTATSVLVPGKPGAPTGVSATPGATSASVSWTAPAANGSAITGYTVTASPGGATCSASSTSCAVPGLTAGVTYTFSVTATNGAGTGAASAASAGVLITDVPGAPTGVAGTAGVRQATLSWAAPSANGSPITGYTVTASPGGASCAAIAPATACVVTGLNAGGSYTFTVTGTNGVGTGPVSVASSPVVLPDVPGAPAGVSGTAGVRQASVSWAASSANGSAITGYTVTASPGGTTCTATAPATSCLVTGLTAGQSYTFSVVATNAVGDGTSSAPSSGVTAQGDPPVDPPPVDPPPVTPPPVDPPPVESPPSEAPPADPEPVLPVPASPPVVKVDAPTPPAPTAPKTPQPVKLTLRVGNSVTASAVARFVALERPKGSELRVAMTGRSTRYCRVTRSKSVWRVHGVRAGTCKLTLTLTPKSGPVVTRKITVPVLKKKR